MTTYSIPAHGRSDSSLSHVAVLSHDFFPWGAPRVAVALVESLTNDYLIQCEVVSLGGGELAIPIRRLVPVHTVGRTWKQPSRGLFSLAYAMHARGYRHIILNTVISGLAVQIFKDLGFHVVALIHEMPKLIASENLLPSLIELHSKADVIVYPHKSVLHSIQAAFTDLPNKSRVLTFPQGLTRRNPYRNRIASVKEEVKSALGIPYDFPLVLGVGICDHRKGFDLFIESAHYVNEVLGEKCHFVWVGSDGEKAYQSHMRSSNQPINTPCYLSFPGYQEDTARYHIASDVFALTSREDPFPNVALESLDAGVPIIAFSGTGGGADIAGEFAGRTVMAFDISAFSEAIVDIIGESQAREAIRLEIQCRIDEEYSFKAYTGKILGLLQDCSCLGSNPISESMGLAR